MKSDLLQLREAIEASWKPDTAYQGVSQESNAALGQCYPTSRVVQHFFPKTEIVKGFVWTGKAEEKHFWNILHVDGIPYHIDLSWRQFPVGSSVRRYEILDRGNLGDSADAIRHCDLLLQRVTQYLSQLKKHP